MTEDEIKAVAMAVAIGLEIEVRDIKFQTQWMPFFPPDEFSKNVHLWVNDKFEFRIKSREP